MFTQWVLGLGMLRLINESNKKVNFSEKIIWINLQKLIET